MRTDFLKPGFFCAAMCNARTIVAVGLKVLNIVYKSKVSVVILLIWRSRIIFV